MLYLAQVCKNEFLEQYQLRLLARQEAENLWVPLNEETLILLGKGNTISDRMLVLVELSSAGEIKKLEDATNWVLYLVQTYLINGITPEFLREETERAEEWRQNLTLQNQDLARRSVELESRREQIQVLEESINREKNDLERRTVELEICQKQIQVLEENLQREKNQLEICQEKIQVLEEIINREQRE